MRSLLGVRESRGGALLWALAGALVDGHFAELPPPELCELLLEEEPGTE